jgi:RNA polymerase sigma-70 factor (ECF subfamily)
MRLSPAAPIGGADDVRGEPVLERLYCRHRKELHDYARRLVGSQPPEPEDVVQATFAQFAALPAPAEVANPRAFLFRIAHNVVIDARRRMSREVRGLDAEALLRRDGADFSPEDVLLPRDELARLEQALAGLKPKQRAALLMHRIDELSFAEIGRRMGLSPSGARKLVEQGFAACMAAMARRAR